MVDPKAKKLGFYTDLDFNFENLEQATCHLIAIYLADKELHKTIAKYNFKGISNWYNETKESTVASLLVQIATFYRIQVWKSDNEDKVKEKNKIVGVLSIQDAGEDVELSMYEACNKIIHADRIYFSTRKIPLTQWHYLKPQISIEGKRGKNKWVAYIDILFFCDSALLAPEAKWSKKIVF